MVRHGSMFAESMRSMGLRQLAAAQVHESLAAWRRSGWKVITDLQVDVLMVRIGLPARWWLLLGLAHLWARWSALRLVRSKLRALQIPMRRTTVAVYTKRKRKP